MHDVHDTDGVGALGGHRKRVPAERLHHEQTDERGGKNGLCVTLSWLTLTWVHLGTGFAQTLTDPHVWYVYFVASHFMVSIHPIITLVARVVAWVSRIDEQLPAVHSDHRLLDHRHWLQTLGPGP
jgi:hypothetical protein